MVPNDAHPATAQLVTNAFNNGWPRIPCVPEDKTRPQSARAHARTFDGTHIMNQYSVRCNRNFAFEVLKYTTTCTYVLTN
eukprot:9941519-Lingulodinium_polyedra.AAC.1